MKKEEFRKKVLEERNKLFSDGLKKNEYDRKIFDLFFSSELYKNSNLFLVYVSFGSEADTGNIINKIIGDKKRVAVPKCTGKGIMTFIEIKSMDELIPGKYGIFEPEYNEACEIKAYSGAVCLTPGAAFDIRGKRIGYGGGYYDRYLSLRSEILRVGICYSEFLFDAVPTEQHDISVSYIITEKGITKVNE